MIQMYIQKRHGNHQRTACGYVIAGEMFSWFKKEYSRCQDSILVMDDDIYLLGDIAKEQQEWIDKGYDRVHYSVCGMYSTTTGRYIETLWPASKTGAGFSLSPDIWKCGRVKSVNCWMPYFYQSLPEHNVKHIPEVKIIHLIHGENLENSDATMQKTVEQGFAVEKDCPVSNLLKGVIGLAQHNLPIKNNYFNYGGPNENQFNDSEKPGL